MSLIATALRHMLASGMDHEAIVAAVAAMDHEREAVKDPVADKRRAWDRERKKRNSTGIRVEPVESAENPRPLPSSPPTPQQPTPTPGDITTRARGSRTVPSSWAPSSETMRVLAAEGHDSGSIERALTMMRDHEFRAARSKWDATFRNWVREDAKRQPRKAHERPHHDAKFDARQANLAAHERGADLAARLYRES